jgi:hydrogenase maturation protease
MTFLVIGLGNPDRGDDGIGVAVARRVAQYVPVGVSVAENVPPVSLVDAWDPDDEVVIVDAMVSGRAPGSLLIVDAARERLPAGGWGSGGTHAMGLSEAVELARALGRMPRRLVVVGIEIDNVLPTDDGLSAQAAAARDAAVEVVLGLRGPGRTPQERTTAAPK